MKLLARCQIAIVVVLTASDVDAQSSHGLGIDYFPANIRPGAYPSRDFKLVLFPTGKRLSIHIPFRLEAHAWSPDGMGLYNTASKGSEGAYIYKIDFRPVRAGPPICPPGLAAVFDLAVSAKEDRLLVSGRVKADGEAVRCGVFEVRVLEGTIRQILTISHCDALSSWHSLSLSPKGDRAVAIGMGRDQQLAIIDIEKRTTQAIGNGFLDASWSPDGKWIAAFRRRGGTVLIDANNLGKTRKLAESRVQWSPDSRYLLRVKECRFPNAVNSAGTFHAVDVISAKSTTVRGSQCSVEGAVGWVSAVVARE